jgi:hypothetical protein
MRTTYTSDKILNLYRATNFTAPAAVYAGLLTAVTDAEAGTVTEASFAGYARTAITFGAPAANAGGRQITNSVAVTHAAKTDVGTATIIAVGIYDALTVGNLLDVILLDGKDPFVAVANDTATEFLRAPAHGLANDQQVRVEQFVGTGTLPTGLSENTTYFVVNTATDQFNLAATQGGAAINITAQGKLLIVPLTPLTLNQNDQANFAIGVLKLADD